jgi:hypothetical protein
MNLATLNNTFDPQTLADDLLEVRRIYAEFFTTLDGSRWDIPVKGGSKEWTLHETVAHLCALTGAGLESIQYSLRGTTYTFKGLDTRYEFNTFNRRGIDEHLEIPIKALCNELLDILGEAANIARNLGPDQANLTAQMSIYNRPLTIVEALGIIMVHAGLFHSAQVAEPAGQPPLWMKLSPEIRHRVIGRTMRAFSLLYRIEIDGTLRTTIVFRVDGPGGGEWYVELSPEDPDSGEGAVEHPGLVIRMRDTAVFCQMLTSRLNLPKVLITGAMKLRGDLRLFPRMGTLFSVDARPPSAAQTRRLSTRQHLTGDHSTEKPNPVAGNRQL